MPPMAQAMPSPVRSLMRSPRMAKESRATTAGMAAMMTPAASAVLRTMPNSMQIENRKLPKNDSRKSSRRERASRAGSPAGRRSQPAITTAAMPKRIQASRKTGKTMTSAFEKPTYAPTTAIAAARQR